MPAWSSRRPPGAPVDASFEPRVRPGAPGRSGDLSRSDGMDKTSSKATRDLSWRPCFKHPELALRDACTGIGCEHKVEACWDSLRSHLPETLSRGRGRQVTSAGNGSGMRVRSAQPEEPLRRYSWTATQIQQLSATCLQLEHEASRAIGRGAGRDTNFCTAFCNSKVRFS